MADEEPKKIPFGKLSLFVLLFPIPIILIVYVVCLFTETYIPPRKYIEGYLFLPILFFGVTLISYFIKKYIPTIKNTTLFELIGRSVIYCWGILFASIIFIRFSEHYIVNYLNNIADDPAEIKRLFDSHNLGWPDTLKSSLSYFYFFDDNRYLIAFIFSLLFIWFYTSKNKISFICPHCLKTILFKNISNITCPLCITTGHSRFELFLYCSSCRESMDYFNCPHCDHKINIKEEYNEDVLRNKRRENAKLEPTLLTGLRELYNRKKRLPQFICKHCLKVLMAKNYNLKCPHCKAEYLVTDNRTQVQVGDVKIKNYRYVGDESTMEKVLFDSCVQCGGIIEVVECYHDDCRKDIDLREEYNEVELLKRRYE